MRFTTTGSNNWNKPTVLPRRCHRPDIHGPLIPMDADEAHWITKAIIIAGGIYGIALWAMPQAAPAFAPSASSQQAVSTADAASIRIAGARK